MVFWTYTRLPARFLFLLREVLTITIATVLAHLNRWFLFYPAAPYLVSGHMTFALGASISIGMLRPWTLAITLPALVPFGVEIIIQKMHTVTDVVGAIPLVLIIYGLIYRFWKMPAGTAPIAHES